LTTARELGANLMVLGTFQRRERCAITYSVVNVRAAQIAANT
jgi:hypothetical protein